MKCQGRWSTSWNQDGWEKYQSPQICRWHHPYGRKWRGTKEPLDGERGEWKSWLKLSIEKMKIMAPSPIISWQIGGEKMGTVTDLIFLVPKSLQMMTEAMKLKDTCSLEEKLKPRQHIKKHRHYQCLTWFPFTGWRKRSTSRLYIVTLFI